MFRARAHAVVLTLLLAMAALVSPAATISANASTTDTYSTPVGGWNVFDALGTLEVKGRAAKTGYTRSQFGSAWSDVDRNGCDTRNDILYRDLTDVTFKPGTKDCVVASGTLRDPYTATRIDFVRGQSTSSAVQIDHVVALSDAWQKGAQKLTPELRRQFANDPYNLLAVEGRANMQKGDGDIATWEPRNKHYLCEYAARQVGVKAKYGLWVTKAERDRFTTIFNTCPDQTIPDFDGISLEEQEYLDRVAR